MSMPATNGTAEFGAMIRALRIARRLSIRQLAAKSGITHAALYNIEAGKHRPRLDSMMKLDVAFGGRVEDLYRDMVAAT